MGAASAASSFSTHTETSTLPLRSAFDTAWRISISFSLYSGAMRVDKSKALLLSDLISTCIFFPLKVTTDFP